MSQRQDDEVSVWFLVAILVFFALMLNGCKDYTDKNGKKCSYDYGTVWDCSSDDCACWDQCVLSSAMSEQPLYNTNLCVHNMCVRRGYSKVCRK